MSEKTYDNTDVVKQDKHQYIVDSIERLESVDERLGTILEKIVGHAKPDTTKEDCMSHSLLDILNQGGNRIADISESINSKITELKDYQI